MKKIAFLLLTLLAFGCSDDEGEIIEKDNQWSIVLNETINSDSYPVYKTEKFLFNHEQLVQHTTKQSIFESEIYREVNLIYSNNKVTTTTDGTTLVYILNSEGYASQCTYSTSYQNREYLFSYSTDGYLTEMTESIDNILCSTITLTYEDGDLTSIISNQNKISNKINYTPGNKSSKYHLPCLGLLETYPFTLHIEALYTGLLGKSPRHFTVKTSPEGNNSEYTTYTYQFDKEGNPTQIHSQTTYPKGDSNNDYPNRRTLSITIE